MIAHLHYITQPIHGKSHAELAEEACKGGAEWVQFRAKSLGFEEWKQEALLVQEVCKKYNARLIINDNVKIAEEIYADGVHLGKNDMDADKAKKILGEDFIVGGTANSYEDVMRLVEWGVDYIGLGPFRYTKTKENLSPILGLEGYLNLMQVLRSKKVQVPVIAIGGVTLDDVEKLLACGVHGVAVSGAINKAESPSHVTKKFIEQLN